MVNKIGKTHEDKNEHKFQIFLLASSDDNMVLLLPVLLNLGGWGCTIKALLCTSRMDMKFIIALNVITNPVLYIFVLQDEILLKCTCFAFSLEIMYFKPNRNSCFLLRAWLKASRCSVLDSPLTPIG